MNHQTEALEQASIRQYCKVVRTPAVAANFIPLAEQAIKEQHSHIRYLEALLSMECEERDRHAIANRIRDAQLPRMKTLEEFDFEKTPQIPAAKIRDLAQGGYIERSEPIVFTGDCDPATFCTSLLRC
jgi:DNA replication protein DnaC